MIGWLITWGATVALSLTASWAYTRLRMRRVERLLHTDSLTGIANRRAFDSVLERLQGTPKRTAVVMIDLDGFKDVNDNHGHAAGDETLRRVAAVLEGAVSNRTGGQGSVFRFGGDEFALLLPSTDAQHAESLIAELREELAEALEAHERSIRVSAGIATSPPHLVDLSTLVSFADRALYQAKHSGRNCSVVYDPDQLNHDVEQDPLALLRILASVLGAAVDAKDAYTHAHSHNVADLSGYLARTMGLGHHEVDEVFLAGLLHDVGKVGVPDAVLTKPGPLDNAEWEQVKEHCEIGYRILNSITGAERVRDMVLYHHERIDGAGYPRRLGGDDIPLGARIIAVADSFDSMTADRVYRRALTTDEALAEIVRHRGTQFDSWVVDALCELMLYDPATQIEAEKSVADIDSIQRPLLASEDAHGGDDERDDLDVAA